MSRGWLIEIEYSLTAGPYQSPVNDSLKANINFEGGDEEILYITKCVRVCVCLCVHLCVCVCVLGGGVQEWLIQYPQVETDRKHFRWVKKVISSCQSKRIADICSKMEASITQSAVRLYW